MIDPHLLRHLMPSYQIKVHSHQIEWGVCGCGSGDRFGLGYVTDTSLLGNGACHVRDRESVCCGWRIIETLEYQLYKAHQ